MIKVSDEKLQKKLGFYPHEFQKNIIENNSRFKVICAGRRGGKSLLSAYLIVKEALLDNKLIWIVAPDYGTTEVIFNQVILFISKILEDKSYSIQKKPFLRLSLNNGTKIECKSAENAKSMLGRAIDFVVVDEAALLNDEIWTQYIRPTTIDKKAKAVLISTPRGENWFYDLWLNAGNGKFHFKSIDNPYFSKEEWEELKKTMPVRIFEQEYEAKILNNNGSVFGDIESIAIAEQKDPDPGVQYVIGVDLAKYNDFTAVVVMDRFKKEMVYLSRFNLLDYNIQKQKIIALARKYNNAKVIIDSSGIGDPIVEDLKREIFVQAFSMHSYKSKQQLIEKLVIYIEQKSIKIINDEVLINELRQYAYEITNAGYNKYSAPKGKNDDTVIALALAVSDLQHSEYKTDNNIKKRTLFNEYK